MIELNSQQQDIINLLIDSDTASATRQQLIEIITNPDTFESDVKELHEAGIVNAAFMDVTVHSTTMPTHDTERIVRAVVYTTKGAQLYGC